MREREREGWGRGGEGESGGRETGREGERELFENRKRCGIKKKKN